MKRLTLLTALLLAAGCSDPAAPAIGPDAAVAETPDASAAPDAGAPDASDPTIRVEVVGEGVVTSVPVGIRCPDSCWTRFWPGQQIELRAEPNPGHHFAGWSGDCAPAYVGAVARATPPASCTAHFEASAPSWARALGGAGGDQAKALVATSTGGFAIAGVTTSFGADSGAGWVARLDGNGAVQWERLLGTRNGDELRAIVETKDGGFLVAGHVDALGAENRQLFVARLDGLGEALWQRSLGAADMDVATAVLETSDGGALVAGFTHAFGAGERDAWLVRLSAAGEVLWQRAYGGPRDDWFLALAPAGQGFVAAGAAESWTAGTTGRVDAWVMKLSESGAPEWQETFGTAEEFDYGLALHATWDGKFLIGGWTSSYRVNLIDAWLLGLSSGGALEWQRAMGGAGYESVEAIAAVGGDFLIGGLTDSWGGGTRKWWLSRMTPSGQLLWQNAVGGMGWDWVRGIVATNDGGFVAAGYTPSFGAGADDAWLVRGRADGTLDPACSSVVFEPTAAAPVSTPAVAMSVQATVTDTDAPVVELLEPATPVAASVQSQCGP